MSQFFASGGRSIGVSASASVLPMNIQDWFPLELTGWISLQSKGLSSVFSNTTVQKHQWCMHCLAKMDSNEKDSGRSVGVVGSPLTFPEFFWWVVACSLNLTRASCHKITLGKWLLWCLASMDSVSLFLPTVTLPLNAKLWARLLLVLHIHRMLECVIHWARAARTPLYRAGHSALLWTRVHLWLRTSHSATGWDSALRVNSLSLCLLPVVNTLALTKSRCFQRFSTPGIGSIESPSSWQRVDRTETTIGKPCAHNEASGPMSPDPGSEFSGRQSLWAWNLVEPSCLENRGS